MQKDVIYIDVEDDITAIISKVKASKDKVVALVPPKRVGVLQSAVNLRLLERAAKQSGKSLALVTNNHALMALATAAAIPVAKNLQSEPELAEIPALEVDDENDIIDGGDLPVGDHAKQAASSTPDSSDAMAAALASAPTDSQTPLKPKVKKSRVPNFDSFRKKLLLGIGGGVLLIAFLIWAIVFAPHATIVINAKTSSSSINIPVTLSASTATDMSKNTLQATTKQQQEDKSQTFTATGKKDAGSKAAGEVKLSKLTQSDIAVPAGTKLTTDSGLVFVTASAATIPASVPCFPSYCAQSTTVAVSAAENGSKYNAATGSLSGAPEGVSASFTGPTSGGVTKMITVVSQQDVVKAKQAIVDSGSDSVVDGLKKQFPSGSIVVDKSLSVDYTDVKVTPDVDQEASQATLTTTVVYKLYGVEKSQLDNFLDAYLTQQLAGSKDQRVYDNGAAGASFSDATAVKNGAKASLVATAQIGPKIDDSQVKSQAKGKRFGEIQQSLESLQGVDGVDVKFFPFWVNSVPNDDSRITIQFKLDESK